MFRIYTLLFGLLCLSFSSKSQQILNFEVTKSTLRMKQLDGTWGEWREFGNINTKMKQKISINFLSKSMYWETQMDGEKTITTYPIIGKDVDIQYKELGLWVLYLKVEDKEGKKNVQYKIGFLTDKKCIMISENETFQNKQELTLLD